MSIEQRFFSFVDYSNDCWEWQGGLSNNGYGRININKKVIRAHRWSYEFFIEPLGDYYCLHQCDNRKCVNPFHLFPGTHKDNLEDMAQKGRARNGNVDKVNCNRGHSLSGDNLRVNINGHRSCKQCRKITNRAWYYNNHEKIKRLARAYQRNYYKGIMSE